jgi:hypothetical protein
MNHAGEHEPAPTPGQGGLLVIGRPGPYGPSRYRVSSISVRSVGKYRHVTKIPGGNLSGAQIATGARPGAGTSRLRSNLGSAASSIKGSELVAQAPCQQRQQEEREQHQGGGQVADHVRHQIARHC